MPARILTLLFVCLFVTASAAAPKSTLSGVSPIASVATVGDTAILGIDVFDAASGGSAVRVRGTTKFTADEVRVLPTQWDEFTNLRYPEDATYPIFTVFVHRDLLEDTGTFHFESGAVALLSTDFRDVKGANWTMIQVVLDNTKSWAWNVIMMENTLTIAFAPTTNVIWNNPR